MVKQTKDKNQTKQPAEEKKAKPQEADVEMSTDVSETIKMKIENDKKIKKQIKHMTTEVNQHYDLK
jgi:hypothetical protein